MTAGAATAADAAWLAGLHDISLSRILHVVVRLGVPDTLANGPLSLDQLAERCGAAPDGLARALRPMVGLGVLALDDGGYRITDTGRLLCRSSPENIAAELGLQAEYLAMAEIEETVRTGRSAMTGQGGFYAVIDRDREWAETFRDACLSRSLRTFGSLVREHDWSGCERLVDVGGGLGHHLEAALEAVPGARGVLLERSAAVALAEKRSWADSVAERVDFLTADYLSGALPKADTAMLINILHNLTDQESGALVARLRDSGVRRLVIGEYVLSDSPADFHPGAAADVWMLVAVGGRERTRGEFTGLLADAGWSVSGIREDPRTRGSLIDCHPAA